MGKKKIVVESDFEDLHGNPEEAPDLELDLSDDDNPIIMAALSEEDDDWTPPEDDDKDDSDDEDEDEDEDDDDADTDDDDDESDSDEDDDDDDSEDEDDDDEDDDDDDDEKYSRRVQKRIDRERELRRQDREESDKRIRKLERRQELRDAQDDFDRDQRSADTKLRALKKQKIEAMDEDETAKVVDIDEEILDIKADIKAKELQLKQTKADIENDDQSGNDSVTSNTPEAGRKWLERYPQFHSNAKFKRVVLLTDSAVAARGFDKNTDAYYEEMEDILRAQFPKIIKKKVKVTKKKRKPKRRSAVGATTKAGTRRSSKRRSSRRGRIRLTKADQAQMEVFGMDPTNPADAKAWAEGKGN